MALKEKAYNQIRRSILNGEFVPGEMLNRRGLAEELDMSPAPVHEAMIQLECDGFLEALPRRGTRVKTVSREDVRGHLIVREALECQIGRIICGEPVAEALDALTPLAEATDESEATDVERMEREVNFHVEMAGCADCPTLATEYSRVMQIGLFYRVNLLLNASVRKPVDRHVVLLEDLVEQSPDEAEITMSKHVWAGKPESIRPSSLRWKGYDE